MPTKPKKKLTLDEAVEASTWRHKPISRRRATVAGLLGIMFGYTGIHNFIMHRKKRGFCHMLISSASLLALFLPLIQAVFVVYSCKHPEFGYPCYKMDSYDDALNVLLIIGIIATVFNVAWGAIEGAIILIHRNRFVD